MNKSCIIKEISIKDLDELKIGNAQNIEAKTGVTVLIFEKGAKVGIDISGGGPASRETPLALPMTADNPINAIVLSGGSAFGLAASDGVMTYLEEHDIGYPTGYAKIPLVCQSCIYDLGIGSAKIRPDAKMGYDACVDSENNNPINGNIGAGIGATVGKLSGMKYATKTGIGIHAVSVGELKVGAVVVLNALGDVFDPETGEEIAGMKNEEQNAWKNSKEELYRLNQANNLFTGNTTIGAIITNGKFEKADLCKIASMTRNAYARCINPVGTMADGDTIYAASVGDVKTNINMVGTLAAEVMMQAIKNAVKYSK